MTTAYTSLLGLALPVTGELSGTWGQTVNDSITSLLDTSVAGTTNVSTDTDVTLTTTTGAANTARQAILLFSGARTALRTVTAPAQSKVYTVINATTGGFSVKLVGAGPTTGLTIPNGASAVVAWNGSDFVEVGAGSIGNLIVNGTLTVTGATTLQSTLAVTGNITNTAGTANGVTYLNGSKVVTSGSALTFDGTTLSATQSSAAQISLNNSSGNYLFFTAAGGAGYIDNRIPSDLNFRGGGNFIWGVYGGSEQMRLNSTGLGIGTSSPSDKLTVVSTSQYSGATIQGGTTTGASILTLKNSNSAGIWQLGVYGSGLTPPNNFYIYDSVNSAVRATIDTSGNLGLGVTPSAWDSIFKAIDVGQASNGISGNSGTTQITQGNYYNSGYKYGITGVAVGRYEINLGKHIWNIAPSGTAGNAITFTQAMTLDASGRLGIGETSPTSRLVVGSVSDASNFLRINSSTVQTVFGSDANGGYVGTDNSYALRFFTNNTERARIDSSGNLLVGTTTAVEKLTIGSTTATSSGINLRTTQTDFSIQPSNSAGGGVTIGVGFVSGGQGPMIFSVGGEKARIDSSGNLLVGTTTLAGTGVSVYKAGAIKVISNGQTLANTVQNCYANTNDDNTNLIEFTVGQYQRTCMFVRNSGAGGGDSCAHITFQYGAGTNAGYISSTGATTSYTSASDYRLKENVQPMQNALAKVAQLNPVTFTWKDNGFDGQGFIAHELQAVIPDAVIGKKDEVYEDGGIKPQAVDTSFLVATLTKAMQEQQAIIESLKARLDAANL